MTDRSRLRSVLSSGRKTTKDWLDRPMTSWHLILAIFFLLLGFGLIMVLSASSITSFRADNSAFSTFQNQAIYAVLGLGGFVFAARVSPKFLRRISFPAMLVALVLLAAVLVIGKTYTGARSWIAISSSVTFQPSELAKVALLLWMAHVLAARRHALRSLKVLLIPVLPIFLLMVLLIMRQPDLGTTVSLTIVFFAVLWFSGAPLWIFGLLAGVSVGGVVALAIAAPYRMMRVLAFLHPSDPAYSRWTYQLNQGLFGMGHGGIFGVGLGQSVQKYGSLPNADSDFIFAIIGEELGLIGTGVLLLLFGMFAYTGMRIARRNVDPYIKIVAASCTVWLVGQAAINIGYVVGLLPVTGIPLPMISAGGTSLVVTMLVFGLLANFARREPQAAAALYSQGPGRMARFLGLGVRTPGQPKKKSAVRKRLAQGAEAKRATRPVKTRPQKVRTDRARNDKVQDDGARRVRDDRARRVRPDAARLDALRGDRARGSRSALRGERRMPDRSTGTDRAQRFSPNPPRTSGRPADFEPRRDGSFAVRPRSGSASSARVPQGRRPSDSAVGDLDRTGQRPPRRRPAPGDDRGRTVRP